jgi:acyl-CoA reductase-like NAD-dependent aldehyde dehydrogenase
VTPLQDDTMVGTLITESEAIRVEKAHSESSRRRRSALITGGQRQGTLITPAIVDVVEGDHEFAQEELFGPAVSITSARDFARD